MTHWPALNDVVGVLDTWYPPETAQSWDAVGLVVGEPTAPIRKVLFAVDPVAAVVAEAIEWRADLLVTHHPLFLRPVSSVAADTFKGQVVHRLIRAGVALYVAHTNADAAVVADALAAEIGVGERVPLVAEEGDPHIGIGRVGRLETPIPLWKLAARVAAVLPPTAQGVRIAGDLDAPVETVAVVGGSGDSLFDAVRAADADVYVTSDLRHHPASELRERAMFEGPADNPTAGKPFLVDTAHFASEWLWLREAAHQLPAAVAALESAPADMGRLECRVSELITDPWTAQLPAPAWPTELFEAQRKASR